MKKLASSRCQALMVSFTLAVLAAGLSGCSRGAAPPPPRQQTTAPAPLVSATPAADRPPLALVQVDESAQGLFDAADAADWSAATKGMLSLEEAASALPAGLPKPDLVAQLRSRIHDVRQDVGAHQRLDTMDAANEITRLAADVSAEFQAPVPYEAVMLSYYGRQLQFGIASEQPTRLAQTRADLRSAWNRLERVILQRGAADDARRFTDIMIQLEGAHQPADFVAPTHAARAEAARIEELFRSP